MTQLASDRTESRPEWLDTAEYPFSGRRFVTADGAMHYVDEGTGDPVLFVHGTPTWSFLFRRLVSRLAGTRRAIAIDHLGFGLSEKPDSAPYEPKDHSARLTRLLDGLDLTNVTMVAHDFGGPIGLAAAMARPERIERLVLLNTWMWPLSDDANIVRGARLTSGAMGRLLYRYLNFPVRVLMPGFFGNKRALRREVHRHYGKPLGTPADREAAWTFARSLLGASDWYAQLWEQRDAIRSKPMALIWGMKDPGFGPRYLQRWRSEFPHAEVHELPESGHFVPEEEPEKVGTLLERILGSA